MALVKWSKGPAETLRDTFDQYDIRRIWPAPGFEPRSRLRQDTGVTSEQWTRLLGVGLPAAAALAVAVVAGLDLDRRRRFRSYLNTEFDLLARMREKPEHTAAADQLARSIERRVLALCAEEEPYTAKERLWRQVAAWTFVLGIFGPALIAPFFGLAYDTSPDAPALPPWGRVVAVPLFIAGAGILAWTAFVRGRRRLKIREAARG